jgi:hypothetical protein
VTITGGVNKCYGNVAIYKAEIDLLAGRVVSLADQTAGTDSTNELKVTYLKNGTETDDSVYPVGITQNDALAGENVTVCYSGYTTAISEDADTAIRGSCIISDTGNIGLVRINNSQGTNEARIGFVAQSDATSINGPVLIYMDGFFQGY